MHGVFCNCHGAINMIASEADSDNHEDDSCPHHFLYHLRNGCILFGAS